MAATKILADTGPLVADISSSPIKQRLRHPFAKEFAFPFQGRAATRYRWVHFTFLGSPS